MSRLDDLIQALNKREKEEIVTVGLSTYNYVRIPFTSATMNYMTFGGIPCGILVEFYGEEHGGKTTTALDIVKNFQRMFPGRKVLYVDCENTLDVEWARKIGVDVESLIIMQPKSQSAESIFQFICEAVETGEVGLFVIDSLGVMMSEQEVEKSLEEKTYAGISKALTGFSKKIEGLAKKYNCTGIGINQVRQNLNSTWGGYTTPGGQAWKHVCAVRMQFRRGAFLDERGKELTRSAATPVGNLVQVSLEKSKVCPPTRRAGHYTINYEYGIDWIADLIETAIRYDVVDQHGSWFTIQDPDTGEIFEDKIHGQAEIAELLSNNKELLEKVNSIISDKISIKIA